MQGFFLSIISIKIVYGKCSLLTGCPFFVFQHSGCINGSAVSVTSHTESVPWTSLNGPCILQVHPAVLMRLCKLLQRQIQSQNWHYSLEQESPENLIKYVLLLQGDNKEWSENMPPSGHEGMEAHTDWRAWTDIMPILNQGNCVQSSNIFACVWMYFWTSIF